MTRIYRSIRMSRLPYPILIVAALFFTSCSALLTSTVIKPAVGNLQKQRDVELVCEGAPAYLLMIDSLIEGDRSNRDLLIIGSQSYSGTVAALESCGSSPERLRSLSMKAKQYGTDLLHSLLPFDQKDEGLVNERLNAISKAEIKPLFWGTFGWLTWVSKQQGSPAAMVDLITIEKLMRRILELDETIEMGSPHLFFGVLYGSKPAMAGGNPEKSRYHFERALSISKRSFLPIQVAYAETYSRMVFDKELHDKLLNEVINFPIENAPDHMLANQIAKRRARTLLEENFF